MARQPNYVKVYQSLKGKIINGDYSVDDLLPSESQLEKTYHVSRTTIRKAVENLVRDGFVAVQQGKGTMVLDYVTMQNLNHVTSFTKTLEDRGYQVRSKQMYADTVAADMTIARALQLEEKETVVRLQRVQLANNKPIAIITNYMPYQTGKSLLMNDKVFRSLYQYIFDEHNLKPDSSVDRITAQSADFAEAQMLDTEVGTALILVTRTCYSNGKPLSMDILKIIGSMYEFEINLLDRDV